MLFKLLRIDGAGKEIELPLGTYVIGKGKLLECENEEIPFNVGCITVTQNKLVLQTVQQNKLFFKEKGSKKIQVLQRTATANVTKTLNNGDSFGLLWKSIWYEVHCDSDKENQPIDVSNTQELNANTKNRKKRRTNERVQSCSESVSSDDESVNSKRSRSPEKDNNVKKTKRKSASKTEDANLVPAKPRERCKYGSTCYSLRSLRRDNSSHKAQYCHPRDPDWGSDGDVPRCPRGARCVRAGAAGALHWTRYSHPPGARPPPPVPRTKANKYWRHHSVYSASDSDSPRSPKLLRARALRLRLRSGSRGAPAPAPAQDEEPEDEDPYATEDSDDWEPSDTETFLDYFLDHC